MAMKTQLGIRHDDSRIRVTRFLALFAVCGVLFASLPCAHADLLSYDNGVCGSVLDYGMNVAVKFTNESTDHKMKIESVRVYGNRQTTGDLDLYLWSEGVGDAPGGILASLPGEYLKVKGWQAFDFTSFGIEIAPGASIFAGFHEAKNDPDDIDPNINDEGANAPYDTDTTTSTNHNWFQIGANAWQPGSPVLTTPVGHLMVRSREFARHTGAGGRHVGVGGDGRGGRCGDGVATTGIRRRPSVAILSSLIAPSSEHRNSQRDGVCCRRTFCRAELANDHRLVCGIIRRLFPCGRLWKHRMDVRESRIDRTASESVRGRLVTPLCLESDRLGGSS